VFWGFFFPEFCPLHIWSSVAFDRVGAEQS
jgi:hypothetical protein